MIFKKHTPSYGGVLLRSKYSFIYWILILIKLTTLPGVLDYTVQPKYIPPPWVRVNLIKNGIKKLPHFEQVQ